MALRSMYVCTWTRLGSASMEETPPPYALEFTSFIQCEGDKGVAMLSATISHVWQTLQ